MATIKRIARNSLVTISAEVVNKIFGLFLTVIIARYLGDSGFGAYSFIVTMMMLFQVLADFGLDTLTIRDISKDTSKTGSILSSALVLKLCLSLVNFLLMVLAIAIMHKPPTVVYGIYLAGLSVIFFSLANSFSAAFNAHEKMYIKSFILVISRALTLIMTVLAVVFKKDLITLIGILLISEIFRTCLSAAVYLRYFGRTGLRIDMSLCKKLFLAALPFALISLVALIYFKIDIVMLSLMKNDQVVGWYSAAYALLAALLFISDAYNLSIFPVLSRYAESAKDLLAFAWERSVKYLLIISAPITVGTTVLADKIVILFYKSGYLPSVPALKVLIWTLPWIFVNSINVRVFYATGKQKGLTWIVVFSALLNIVLNLFLIPVFSYMGASAATLASEVVNVCVCFWLISGSSGFRISIVESLAKPVIASIMMGAVVYCLRSLNILPVIIIGTFSYLICLIILGTFDSKDRMIMKEVISPVTSKGRDR